MKNIIIILFIVTVFSVLSFSIVFDSYYDNVSIKEVSKEISDFFNVYLIFNDFFDEKITGRIIADNFEDAIFILLNRTDYTYERIYEKTYLIKRTNIYKKSTYINDYKEYSLIHLDKNKLKNLLFYISNNVSTYFSGNILVAYATDNEIRKFNEFMNFINHNKYFVLTSKYIINEDVYLYLKDKQNEDLNDFLLININKISNKNLYNYFSLEEQEFLRKNNNTDKFQIIKENDMYYIHYEEAYNLSKIQSINETFLFFSLKYSNVRPKTGFVLNYNFNRTSFEIGYFQEETFLLSAYHNIFNDLKVGFFSLTTNNFNKYIIEIKDFNKYYLIDLYSSFGLNILNLEGKVFNYFVHFNNELLFEIYKLNQFKLFTGLYINVDYYLNDNNYNGIYMSSGMIIDLNISNNFNIKYKNNFKELNEISFNFKY